MLFLKEPIETYLQFINLLYSWPTLLFQTKILSQLRFLGFIFSLKKNPHIQFLNHFEQNKFDNLIPF